MRIDIAGIRRRMVASKYGFLVFSVTGTEVFVQAVDYQGKVFYKTALKKGEPVVH